MRSRQERATGVSEPTGRQAGATPGSASTLSGFHPDQTRKLLPSISRHSHLVPTARARMKHRDQSLRQPRCHRVDSRSRRRCRGRSPRTPPHGGRRRGAFGHPLTSPVYLKHPRSTESRFFRPAIFRIPKLTPALSPTHGPPKARVRTQNRLAVGFSRVRHTAGRTISRA